MRSCRVPIESSLSSKVGFTSFTGFCVFAGAALALRGRIVAALAAVAARKVRRSGAAVLAGVFLGMDKSSLLDPGWEGDMAGEEFVKEFTYPEDGTRRTGRSRTHCAINASGLATRGPSGAGHGGRQV